MVIFISRIRRPHFACSDLTSSVSASALPPMI